MHNSTKLFNFRPLVLWAFFVGVTIVMCLWSVSVGWWLNLIWFAVLGATLASLWWRKQMGVFAAVGLALCLAACGSFLITHNHFTNQPYLRGPGEMTGIVRAVTVNDEGRASVTLSSVVFRGEGVNGRVRLLVPLATEQFLDEVVAVGNVINVWTNPYRPWDSGSAFHVNNGFRYQARAMQGNVAVVGQSGDLRSVVLRYTNNFFHNHMNETNAELMYSMLFGDRSGLEGEVRDNFSLTGLAHVLAVSGMHVGLIVGILLWILKLFKTGKRTQFIIILLTLALYVFMADFRYSIMRASIMFLILLFNRLWLRRVETVSSISMAAIIILIIWPHSLWSLSFRLSFACLYGIALFYRPIHNWISLRLAPMRADWFVTGLTLYIVTAITTFPLLVGTFGYFPIIGIVANVMLLPMILFAFQVSVIALVTWVGFPLLYVADWLLWVVLRTSAWLGSASWQNLAITQYGYWFLLYFVGLIVASRFVFIKRRAVRYGVAGVLILIYVITLLSQTL